MFKHSKVLNLSPPIRQGGDENKVSYKNFRKLASNLASTTRKARVRERWWRWIVLLFCYFFHILFSSQMRPALCLAFINFCHLGAGFALQRWSRSKYANLSKGEPAKIQIFQWQKIAPLYWRFLKKWNLSTFRVDGGWSSFFSESFERFSVRQIATSGRNSTSQRPGLDFSTSEAGGRARWSLLPIARVSEVAGGTTRRPDHPIAGGGRRQVGRRAWQSR